MARWRLEDNTSATGGYMRIFFNQHRIADVFPFAAGENADHVRSRAESLVATMNAVDEWRRVSHERGTPHAAFLNTDEGTILMRAVDSLLTGPASP